MVRTKGKAHGVGAMGHRQCRGKICQAAQAWGYTKGKKEERKGAWAQKGRPLARQACKGAGGAGRGLATKAQVWGTRHGW